MDKSLFQRLVGAAFCSAILVSSVQAQENGNALPGSIPGPLEPAVCPPQQATDGPCDPLYICLWKSAPGLEVNGSLLFLQPSSGNLLYATKITPFPFVTPHWDDQTVNPGFTPAFEVGARYDFGSGCDVQLNWTHFASSDSASAVGNPTPVFVPGQGTFPTQALGPPFLTGPPPPFTTASAGAHFEYDAVNLDGGLLLAAGNHVHLRLFAGIEGARVSQSLSTSFLSADGTIGFNDASKSVFTGVGPRLGLDVHYSAGGFDFLCGLAGATLIGNMQNHMNFFTASPTVIANGLPINNQFLTSPDSTRLVPSIDARLGASYAIPLGSFGILKCELGYQAAAYINAVTQYSVSEVSNTATFPLQSDQYAGVFLRTVEEPQSNFLVHGPYLKISWEF